MENLERKITASTRAHFTDRTDDAGGILWGGDGVDSSRVAFSGLTTDGDENIQYSRPIA
jgi:hypothetical protein